MQKLLLSIASVAIIVVLGAFKSPFFTDDAQFDAPQFDDNAELSSGYYLLLCYREKDGKVDTFIRDTFTLERGGDIVTMRHFPETKRNKGRELIHGVVDNDMISGHSRKYKSYYTERENGVLKLRELDRGKFFFNCKIGKNDIIGHGSMPGSISEVFGVHLMRIAVPLIDNRHGRYDEYQTIRIGNQFWMAENLRYYDTLGGIYGNPDLDTSKYGLYYTWEAAQRACPNGWHLPSRKEWEDLVKYLGGKDAGVSMKALTGWGGATTSGSDFIGFSAYPAGYYNPETESFKDIKDHAFFWSSEYFNKDKAWYRNLFIDYPGLYEFNDKRYYGLNCRCIQN